MNRRSLFSFLAGIPAVAVLPVLPAKPPFGEALHSIVNGPVLKEVAREAVALMVAREDEFRRAVMKDLNLPDDIFAWTLGDRWAYDALLEVRLRQAMSVAS